MNLFIRGLVGKIVALLRLETNGAIGVVRMPKAMPILFLVFGLPIGVLSIILFVNEVVIGGIVCLVLAMLSSFFIVAYFVCRTKYDEVGFVYRSFFGYKRSYRYEDITGIKYHPSEYRLYMGEKTLSLDKMQNGARDFVIYAEKQYASLHDGRRIPISKKEDRDIFKGNSPDKGVSYIVTYLLVLVLAIGLFAGALYYLFGVAETITASTVVPVIFLGIPLIIWIVYGIFAVKVGRNPKKYGMKIVSLFFADGYIRFK